MQSIDFSSSIAQLDAQIADAKNYLKKLRQYKKVLAKIEQEQAAQPVVAPAVPAPIAPIAAEDLPAEVSNVPVVDAPDVTVAIPVDPWMLDPDPSEPLPPSLPPATPAPRLYLLPPAQSPDLGSLGIRELRQMAKGKIKNAARMNKADLLTALAAA